MMNIQQRQAKR